MKQHINNNISSPYRINYYASYIATKIALGTGMRLGEVFGLCWNCVDLIHGTISVRRTIQTGTKGQVFQDTKTKTSRRCIPISQELQNELTTYKALQSNYAKELGDKWADSYVIVISGNLGKILSTDNSKSRYFIPILKTTRLRPYHIS
ncbi:tyrosine-type recombinase/integrase [Veillonella parvula]|uniref:tyrosine-type recombinase/integrase n=1 Tax=Veillonella parvula TaxID=29466 RepID=UPI00241C00AD|nr:tyrosine-type recombinase/integrase [Veillonella parvula]